MIRRLLFLLAVFGLAAGPAACASAPEDESALTVFAAASLTDAFEVLADEFERSHPGVQVRLNFAGSQSLRTQLENGARADVFASANPKHMNALLQAGLVSDSTVFASNALVIAVPADNPAGVKTFLDLPRVERLVLAGEDVPAGAYAAEVLRRARSAHGKGFVDAVLRRIVSRENDVRATLQKVVLGEADAAIVYATDALAAGLPAIEIPSELNVRASYPIATVAGSELGRRFTDWVSSVDGQRRLAEFGFASSTDGMSASSR